MVCLGNEQRSFCHFWDCTQVLHFGLFCSPWWLLHFLKFKLVLEKAEEPEIKLPTSTRSWKKQESSRETPISALLTMPKPLCGSQLVHYMCIIKFVTIMFLIFLYYPFNVHEIFNHVLLISCMILMICIIIVILICQFILKIE